jgi:hypothetical protein
MARRPDGWNSDRWASGRDGSIVRTADRELKSSDSEALLNSRIPAKHLYTQVILSKTQNEAKILTYML